MNDLIIALLALAFCGSAAAFLIMWANRDEWKKIAKEERARWEDEIINGASMENALYNRIDFWRDACEKVTEERNELQDRVSTLVCPHNDHVWLEGRCKKCGRLKE